MTSFRSHAAACTRPLGWRIAARIVTLPVLAALVCACATGLHVRGVGGVASAEPPPDATRQENVWAVTAAGELIRFVSGTPQRVLERRPLQGLVTGEHLVGIDVRVARGTLYALSSQGRLYTVDVANGRLAPVGAGSTLSLGAQPVGFDFNPVADRIRVVAADGRNWRLHPDTGAVAAEDPAVRYADSDVATGRRPALAGAAYTYNAQDHRLTTNYAIDRVAGTLVRQGSLEGTLPVVSPNTGLLYTVGALGTGAFDDAAFDIDDVRNTALAALRQRGRTRLYRVDLTSGRATLLGTVDGGDALVGLAIQP